VLTAARSDVPMESQLWREEVFGPVLAVRFFKVSCCEFFSTV
jgi:hypothetical protein